ncbi:hypothetical protein V491_05032 [Pseudogymnoascus sp. VKM F-3775]|nr:hypothetical protein V491_05032 [Pseudogymnoascus sp. VKM F-3775]
MDLSLHSKPPAKKSKNLRKFKFFPSLPTEIRLMIWTLCLPRPRVVDVRMRRKSIPTSTGELLGYGRFVSSVDHPVLLHVCSESRKLARKHYKLAFPKETKAEWSPARIYIDFSVDTIWFDHLRYFPSRGISNTRLVPEAEFAKIKYLVMRHCMEDVMDKSKVINPKFFPALETIYTIATTMQPHRIKLAINTSYTNSEFTTLWSGEKKCPILYSASTCELAEGPSEVV